MSEAVDFVAGDDVADGAAPLYGEFGEIDIKL